MLISHAHGAPVRTTPFLWGWHGRGLGTNRDAIELGLFQDAAPQTPSFTSGTKEDQAIGKDKGAPPADTVGEGVTDSTVEGKGAGSTTPLPSQGAGAIGGAASVTPDDAQAATASTEETQPEASAVERLSRALGGGSGNTGPVAVEEVSRLMPRALVGRDVAQFSDVHVLGRCLPSSARSMSPLSSRCPIRVRKNVQVSVIELSDERQDLQTVFPGSAGGPLRQLSLVSEGLFRVRVQVLPRIL